MIFYNNKMKLHAKMVKFDTVIKMLHVIFVACSNLNSKVISVAERRYGI
jgi:hypothetical protein